MTTDLHDLLVRAGDVLAAPSVAPPAEDVRRAATRRRRRRTVASSLAAFAVLAAGVGTAAVLNREDRTVTPAQASGATIDDRGLRLTITPERDVVDESGLLEVTVTVTNGRDRAVRLGDGLGPPDADVHVALSVQYPSGKADPGRFTGAVADLYAQWVATDMIHFFSLYPRSARGDYYLPPRTAPDGEVLLRLRDVVVEPGESVTRRFAWRPEQDRYPGYTGKVAVTAVVADGRERATPRRDPFTGAEQIPGGGPAPEQASFLVDVHADEPRLTQAQAAERMLSDPQFAAWVESVGGPPAAKWNGSRLAYKDGRWEGWLDTTLHERGLPEGLIVIDARTGEVLSRRMQSR